MAHSPMSVKRFLCLCSDSGGISLCGGRENVCTFNSGGDICSTFCR